MTGRRSTGCSTTTCRSSPNTSSRRRCASDSRRRRRDWVDAWNDFVVSLRKAGVDKLPGFPIWVDEFVHEDDLIVEDGTPAWKANFLRKNAAFYTRHQELLEDWLKRWGYLRDFPASRRKFEWQAQSAASLDETVMHLRPSGLRAKRATYVPALVAITQTSILGDRRRRLSPREVARFKGCPSGSTSATSPTPRPTSRPATA